MDKNHQYQQKAYTCGPTCVHMVADYLGVKHGGAEEIEQLCNCTNTTGTIDTGIKNALDTLGIPNEQNTKHTDDVSVIAYLNNVLTGDDVFIMRTLTRGIKHWIVIYKYDNGVYFVADPWLGKIQYSVKQILAIWKPRNFDGFRVFK